MAKTIYLGGVDALALTKGPGLLKSITVSNPTASATDNVIVHDSATDNNAVMHISVQANDTVTVPGFDFVTGIWIEHSSTDLLVTVIPF